MKLELSTTQQDLELPKQSRPSLACSPECSDTAEELHCDILGKIYWCCVHLYAFMLYSQIRAVSYVCPRPRLELRYKPDLLALTCKDLKRFLNDVLVKMCVIAYKSFPVVTVNFVETVRTINICITLIGELLHWACS